MDILGETVLLAGPQVVDALVQNRKAKAAATRLQDQENMMQHIMNTREDISNPFADVTNPYNNVTVATQAAEMQAQQTDQALANTLDTLRATGTSAGGATALARAAAQSKQGVSASIEAQESKNQELIAAGQQRMEQLQGMGEQNRAERQEARDDQQISFHERKADRAYQEQVNRQNNTMQSLTGALGAVSGNYEALSTAFGQKPTGDIGVFGDYKHYLARPDEYNLNTLSGAPMSSSEFAKFF